MKAFALAAAARPLSRSLLLPLKFETDIALESKVNSGGVVQLAGISCLFSANPSARWLYL